MNRKHGNYSALQTTLSPGIQTYRDALFPGRQTPREHQLAARVSVIHDVFASNQWDNNVKKRREQHTPTPSIAKVSPTSSVF